MRKICLVSICIGGGFFSVALAQTDAPLFATHEALELRLEAPIRTLVRRRSRRPEVDGILSYRRDDGREVRLDLEVSTRGNSRLELCDFPPLRFDLKREQLDGTVFDSQNRLKVVTQCQSSSDYADNLELEYLAYRIFNEMTDISFRVRPVRMTYVDTDRHNRVTEAPAFIIEDIDAVAARAGMETVDVPSIDPAALAEPDTTKFWLFQYLIGNTDVSDRRAHEEECCHNGDVLMSPGPSFVVVPYDFDQAGLVDADYALPDPRLGIDTVRERRYRGRCESNDYVDEVVALVLEARPRIESLFETAALSERARRRAIDFISAGLDLLADPAERRELVVERCR